MRRIYVAFVVLSLVSTSISCAGGPTSPTSTTTPAAPAAAVPTAHTFAPFGGFSPPPLPDGKVQGVCGVPNTVPATIKGQVTPSPGGTMLQIYLIARADFLGVACSASDAVCPGAVDSKSFMQDLSFEWKVEPGNWCIGLRSRSQAPQNIDGSVAIFY